jgi:hypothetical protein
MRKPESRTLEELVTLYRLAPELRDIYVEGSNDRSLVEWLLGVQGIGDVVVKDIDSVEVPPEIVLQRGLEDNRRGRVITLAHYLEAKFGPDFLAVTCIADGDFDHVNSRTDSSQLLFLTDYTSPEMYFFNSDSVGKLLRLALPSFPKTADRVLVEIRPVLEDLFVVRMANASLKWGLTGVNYEKCCQLVAAGVNFDSDKCITRYLQANSRHEDKIAFLAAVSVSRQRLTSDPRVQIHGHDFVNLLAWYVRQHKGFKSVRRDVVERALFATAESSQLMKERLFQSLVKRLR